MHVAVHSSSRSYDGDDEAVHEPCSSHALRPAEPAGCPAGPAEPAGPAGPAGPANAAMRPLPHEKWARCCMGFGAGLIGLYYIVKTIVLLVIAIWMLWLTGTTWLDLTRLMAELAPNALVVLMLSTAIFLVIVLQFALYACYCTRFREQRSVVCLAVLAVFGGVYLVWQLALVIFYWTMPWPEEFQCLYCGNTGFYISVGGTLAGAAVYGIRKYRSTRWRRVNVNNSQHQPNAQELV